MKKIIFGILVVLMISLCGCGEKTKAEKEIQADLQAHPDFWNAQEVTIEEITLIKRQTDEKNKTDKVYVSVIAGNDKVECKLGYYLNYGLYDSGWILDSVSEYSEVDKIIIPKMGPTEDDAKKYLPIGDYTVKSIGEADLVNGTCVVEYEEVLTFPLFERVTLMTEQFKFRETDASWVSTGGESTVTEYWQIEGHWQAEKPKDFILGIPARIYDLYISDVDTSGYNVRVVVNGEEVLNKRKEGFYDPIVFEVGAIIYSVYLEEEEIKFSTDTVFKKID